MLKVGVTGGIGSGKTTVCKIFEVLGVPVFSADFEAKKLLEKEAVIQFYRNQFGDSVFSNQKLDHAKIANLIFSNKNALIKVNEYIHPLVRKQFERWSNQHSGKIYVIKEAALLFESGMYHELDYNILVTAPVEIRVERILHRDQTTREKVFERMDNQWPDEKKQDLANSIIYNDGLKALLPQVLELDKFIKHIYKK